MNLSNTTNTPEDIWQVEVNGQIYETNLQELKQWIAERSVLPTDKVRVGDKRFVQARLIPQFAVLFANSESVKQNISSVSQNVPMPANNLPIQHHTAINSSHNTAQTFQPAQYAQPNTAPSGYLPPPPPMMNFATGTVCVNHPELVATLMCRGCGSLFCKACPKTYGSVKICHLCGEMCKALETNADGQLVMSGQTNISGQEISIPFGIESVANAIAYPFRHFGSLIGGGIITIILSFGLFLSTVTLVTGLMSIGLIATLICLIASISFGFGCMAQTVENFAYGNRQKGFIPDYTDFSIGGSLFTPFLSGLGINIVTYLPMVIVLVIGWLLLPPTNSMTFAPSPNTYQNKSYNFDPQTGKFNPPTSQSSQADESFTKQQPSRNPATDEYFAKVGGVLLKISPLILLAFIWSIIYYPAALIVAATSQDYGATVNPAIGIDTIRRMGGTYWIALCIYIFMGIILGMFVGVLNVILHFVPFGEVISGVIFYFIMFYFSIVVSALFGMAVNSKRHALGI